MFKCIVLTKLLYAAPVWLDKNLDIYKDFFARALLKLAGSEFHLPWAAASMLINMPTLDIMVNTCTVKFIHFILKCLRSADVVNGLFLQVESTPEHPFYSWGHPLNAGVTEVTWLARSASHYGCSWRFTLCIPPKGLSGGAALEQPGTLIPKESGLPDYTAKICGLSMHVSEPTVIVFQFALFVRSISTLYRWLWNPPPSDLRWELLATWYPIIS